MPLDRQRWYPQLEGSGTNFLTIQAIRKSYELLYGLEDSEARLLEGLHAERDTSYPPGDQKLGTWFYETDREALYLVATIDSQPQWSYIAGVMRNAVASRPGDLQLPDENFLFEATDQTVTYRWSGTAWVYHSGTMRGTLDPNEKPSPTAAEVGFLFFSTDFEHLYRWSGVAWTFAPGDSGSKFIVAGIAAPLGGLWSACDGSAVNVATASGSFSSITTPDLNDDIFIKGGGYTGTKDIATVGTWDAAAITDDEATHVHAGPSHVHGSPTHSHTLTTQEVQSGTGEDVSHDGSTGNHSVTTNAAGTDDTGAGGAHSHALSDANAVLKAPSETDGGLPLRINLVWYMRR